MRELDNAEKRSTDYSGVSKGGKYGAHYKKTISTNQQVKALRFCSGLTAKVASNSKQRTVQLDLQPNI